MGCPVFLGLAAAAGGPAALPGRGGTPRADDRPEAYPPQTTVNNRQRRAAAFSYCKRFPKSVAGFPACWFLKVICPQGVPSGNADWKVRNTLREPREPFTVVDGGLRWLTVVCQSLPKCMHCGLGVWETTVNNRQRRAAPFSYCKRLPSWCGCLGMFGGTGPGGGGWGTSRPTWPRRDASGR
jgi:hypothetical protein